MEKSFLAFIEDSIKKNWDLYLGCSGGVGAIRFHGVVYRDAEFPLPDVYCHCDERD